MTEPAIVNAMTVDVEDYFQVLALEPHIARQQWDSLQHRVEGNTQRVLELFDQHGIKATFFTLGWIAERHPGLVKSIIAAGHELASHGYEHIQAFKQTPEQFRQDVRLTKHILEDIGGQAVIGYRAASYSIGAKNLWALTVLEEEGFLYSSSVYPVKHDIYGMPDAPRFQFKPTENKQLLEIPISTFKFGPKNLPCGGGGFFRFYPYWVSKAAYRYLNNVEKQPGIFYFHPWEIDPDQPKQSGLSLKTRFRHYLNLSKMEGRLTRLVEDFRWDTMQAVFLTNTTGDEHKTT